MLQWLLAGPLLWVAGMAFFPLAGIVAGFTLVLYPLGVLVAPVEQRARWGIGWAPLAFLLAPWIAVLSVVGLAAIVAPGVALAWWLNGLVPELPYGFPLGGWFGQAGLDAASMVVGACGVWGAIRGAWLGIIRRGTVLALMRALPTSTIRGAAEGLVELRGVARAAGDAAPGSVIFPRGRAVPFELEDGTGRVRVDPRGVPFRAGGWNPFGRLFAPGWIEIVLDQPALKDGDRVYVIGTLATRDGERTIAPAPGRWSGGLPGSVAVPIGVWGAHTRIFMLSGGTQADADMDARMEPRTAALLVAVWLLASGALLAAGWASVIG